MPCIFIQYFLVTLDVHVLSRWFIKSKKIIIIIITCLRLLQFEMKRFFPDLIRSLLLVSTPQFTRRSDFYMKQHAACRKNRHSAETDCAIVNARHPGKHTIHSVYNKGESRASSPLNGVGEPTTC